MRPEKKTSPDPIAMAAMSEVVKDALQEHLKDALKDALDKSQAILDIGNKIGNINSRIDTIETSVDQLDTKLDKNSQALGLKLLDYEVHERKWNLILKGLQGDRAELSTVTNRKFVELGHHLFNSTYVPPLKACHRLSSEAGARVIVSFMKLNDRNFWLQNAKVLHRENMSLQPDLPPIVRPLQSELLTVRKNLDAAAKKRCYIKYTPTWPYVTLIQPQSGDQEPIIIHPTAEKSVIIEKLLSN